MLRDSRWCRQVLSVGPPPNKALHTDQGHILLSRDTTPLQRPRRVNSNVMRSQSMPRRKQLKGLACGIASRFASRNNDIDGYWALGLLYSAAVAVGTNSLRLDLVNETAEPSFKYSARLLSQLNHYLQDRLAKLDLTGYVFAATIDVVFNIERRPNDPNCRSTWGDPFL